MTPTTALKQISKVKQHIAALELRLAFSGVEMPEDNELIEQDLQQLRQLLKQYEEVLKERNVI
jgi:hypothetical protein